MDPASLVDEFKKSPLYQRKYSDSLGTLFTADYDPTSLSLELHWPGSVWAQSLDNFQEGTRHIVYESAPDTRRCETVTVTLDWLQHLAFLEYQVSDRAQFSRWMDNAKSGEPDWAAFASVFSERRI